MWLGTALSSLAATVAVVHTVEAASLNQAVHAELASDIGWAHSYTDGDIRVSQKTLPSLGQVAFQGETTLPPSLPARRLLDILVDTESHKRFNRNLAESVVVQRRGEVTTFYQVVKTPSYVPLSDRWWVVQAVSVYDADGTPGHLRRMWSTIPSEDMPAIRDLVVGRYPNATEVTYSHGSWDLIPNPDGSTHVIYRIVSDPGGSVPRALATRFAGRSVADNLRTMLGAAGKP